MVNSFITHKEPMQRLTRDDILAVKPKTKELYVADWGGSVVIQELTLAQQQAIGPNTKDNYDAGLKMFLECVIEPRFEAADYAALKAKGVGALDFVLNEILALSKVTKEAQQDTEKK